MSTAVGSPFDPALAVADSVLYEGYLLYPYRKSSGKNRMRWQFGVLEPRNWIEARGPVVDGVAGSAEWWFQQTECLLEGSPATRVSLRPRYLQVQQKVVERPTPDGGYEPVGGLDVGDRVESSFEEAVARDLDVTYSLGQLLAGRMSVSIDAPGGEDVAPLLGSDGRTIGRVVRRRDPVAAELQVSATRVQTPFPLFRLRARVLNTDTDTPADVPREQALLRSLVSAHLLVAVEGGSFLSLLDPPHWATEAARECRNLRTFPVLAGPPGPASLLLSAPVILYDHPQVSPQSPGDLHDATEIDEILSLRTLTLSDEEKREARGTDARAAAIVDRVDAMSPATLGQLHGVLHSEGQPERILVGDRWVAPGDRVVLLPRRRGSDAADMFLEGRRASVHAVLCDVDGRYHLAVTVDDDPAAELHQWYGRFHYFGIDEVMPLDDAEVAP